MGVGNDRASEVVSVAAVRYVTPLEAGWKPSPVCDYLRGCLRLILVVYREIPQALNNWARLA